MTPYNLDSGHCLSIRRGKVDAKQCYNVKEVWTVCFTINKPSRVDASAEINGLKVMVREGSNQIEVDGCQASDRDRAEKDALRVINDFLNALSWRCDEHLALDFETGAVSFFDHLGNKFIRPAPAVVHISARLTAVKKDASGSILEICDSQKIGKIAVKASEAAAFYRRAHLSIYPFDQFGNLYKVVENIADQIRMKKGMNKEDVKRNRFADSYEKSLLQLALEECFRSNLKPLLRATKNILTIDKSLEVIPSVADKLCKTYRCQIMHSKASLPKKVPFDPQDEKDVQAAVKPMDFIARELLQYEESTL